MNYDPLMTIDFFTDSEAMISLAATCVSRTPKFSTDDIGLVAARRLYHKISGRGLPANIYELALMTQVCHSKIMRCKVALLPPIHTQNNGETVFIPNRNRF